MYEIKLGFQFRLILNSVLTYHFSPLYSYLVVNSYLKRIFHLSGNATLRLISILIVSINALINNFIC